MYLTIFLIVGYRQQHRRNRPKRWDELSPAEKAAEFLRRLQEVREAELPRESASWQRMMADPGITMGDAGGNCPVQIRLEVDDHSAYFRARGSHWSFQVASPEYFAPCKDDQAIFAIKRYYGEWPSAGHMTMAEASDLLEEAIAEFRDSRLKVECVESKFHTS